MGDGVLIYFGYPQAHEDDAERAVGAALAVIEAVRRLPAREDLLVRLGIATGLAVGRRFDRRGGSAGARGRWRDAEPCRSAAGPGYAEHAGDCRREPAGRSASYLIWKTSGHKQLAGFAEPQRAWRVLAKAAR